MLSDCFSFVIVLLIVDVEMLSVWLVVMKFSVLVVWMNVMMLVRFFIELNDV